MSSERQSLRARWVFPVDTPPIEHGTIEWEDGRITALHASCSSDAVDLGDVAIIPGLVNTHTHLEFSDLTDPLSPATSFFDWVRAVVAYRRSRTGNSVDAIVRGLHECYDAGATTLGEIATADWSVDDLDEKRPRLVVFRELLTLSEDQIDGQLAVARAHLERWASVSSADVIAGLSPHTPYTVHRKLFHELVDLARGFHAPLAIHLAETQAELEFLTKGTGDCVEMLRRFGVWRDGLHAKPTDVLEYLQPLAELDRALVIHGNYLSPSAIAFLAKHPHLTVVYCPRTHAYFGHSEHPWRQMLEQGVSVALGTDSRASNPDLSLWNELMFLSSRYPKFDRRILLELGTKRGAVALGLQHETGALAIGRAADLAVVSLDAATQSDPYTALFSPRNQIIRTICSSEQINGLD